MLRFAGELDIDTATDLRDRIRRAVDERAGALVIDLSEVSFIDSISLAVLVAARRRLGEDGRLALVAGRDSYVSLILTATGLHRALDVFEDRSAAQAFAYG